MDDLHNRWHHRWINPKTKEGTSVINKNGLIAIEDIAEGEAVIVYGGVIIPKEDLLFYRNTFGNYDVPLDDGFSIAPTTKSEIMETGSVNHSCEPNLGWKNALTLATTRKVQKGEELTVEYAMHGGYPDDMKCNCGTPSCRKVITKDDWKNPQIRAKYGRWFMPFVKAKF